jgi:hypothetical protein
MRSSWRSFQRGLLAAFLGFATIASLYLAVGLEAPPRGAHTSSIVRPPADIPAEPAPTPTPAPGATPAPAPTAVGPPPTKVGLYRAPTLSAPLVNVDPGLASRGPRPTLTGLLRYQFGSPLLIVDPRATFNDWELARPNENAVHGYADALSVLPGETLGLHLNGQDHRIRLDVFRMGLGDGRHVLTVPSVALTSQPEATPRPADGLVEESWPETVGILIPPSWKSGVYLIKMTGESGGQAYVLFIVRSPTPTPITVVLPMTTYQAYNLYGGADLYNWPNGPKPRSYRVSFDRPFDQEWGAGLFFRLDFPLIVWLEDHGYTPSYIADLDIAKTPDYALQSGTLIFSGHGEYWSGATRGIVESAAARGTNLAFFGSNQGFWQIRLEDDSLGAPARTVICYKSALLDPITPTSPAETTVRFEDPPVERPPSALMGLSYGGVIDGIQPMAIGPGLARFDPGIDLKEGDLLPGLIADEVDEAEPDFNGILLGATQVFVRQHGGFVTAGTSLWVGGADPTSGVAGTGSYRVFDAGTFDYSWGLDPRYSAALNGFPAPEFTRLTAEILAWLGARPSV